MQSYILNTFYSDQFVFCCLLLCPILLGLSINLPYLACFEIPHLFLPLRPSLFIYSLLSYLLIASLLSSKDIQSSSHFFHSSDFSLISLNTPFRSLLAYCATSQSLTPQGSLRGRNRESVETTTSEVRSS
jgi:hypothetical protein